MLIWISKNIPYSLVKITNTAINEVQLYMVDIGAEANCLMLTVPISKHVLNL